MSIPYSNAPAVEPGAMAGKAASRPDARLSAARTRGVFCSNTSDMPHATAIQQSTAPA